VLHPGRVERRAPAALVVARELEVEALAGHADRDPPDAGPGVEPRERKRAPDHLIGPQELVFAIADAPDNMSAAAVFLAVSASGAVQIKTTILLTPEERIKQRRRA
jgi:hypothetical protein